MMIPVGWRKIKSWNCIECGMCCIKYHVVLNYMEWVDIIRNYGVDATIPSVSNLLFYVLFTTHWMCCCTDKSTNFRFDDHVQLPLFSCE